MEALQIDISITPPSFKPVALSLSRSPLSKTPKQVFFLTLSIFCHFYQHYNTIIKSTFFILTSIFLIYKAESIFVESIYDVDARSSLHQIN